MHHDAARFCDDCGAPRPQPRQILEMDNAAMRELQPVSKLDRILRMSYGQLLRARRTEEELAAYAKAHGYRPGWVWHKLREQEERFGGPAGRE
jgi:hypothetical protein